MERTHGRTKRTLELVRRELDSNGNPHAQPPRMVNTSLSRDEVERAEREGMQRRNTALLQQNLKSFHAVGEAGTVADAMLMPDDYLQWRLDSRPVHPHLGPEEISTPRPTAAAGRDSKPEPQLPVGDYLYQPKPPSSARTQLARSIAVEVGVKVSSAKVALKQKLEDEPYWGRQTRRTMKSMGVTDGLSLRKAIAAKFGDDAEPAV